VLHILDPIALYERCNWESSEFVFNFFLCSFALKKMTASKLMVLD
jgi:hypothetical protein